MYHSGLSSPRPCTERFGNSHVSQCFFANRIRILSQRWELAIAGWFLSLLRYAMAILMVVEELRIPSQVEFDSKWKWTITVTLAIGAVNDVLIAAGLTYTLHGSRSGLAKSNLVINRVIRFTIRTCGHLPTLPRFSWNFRDRNTYQRARSKHAHFGERSIYSKGALY